jgi:hypothetical protein
MMKLERHVLLGLKSVIAHNTAQKMLQDKGLGKQYLAEVESLLSKMIVPEQVQEVMLYARMKSRSEVKTIRSMYNRMGVQVNVQGHGGSEIHIEVLLEQLLQTAITREEE